MSNLIAAGFMRKRSTIWGLFLLLWLGLGVFSAGTVLVELPPIRRAGPPPPGSLSYAWRAFLYQLAIWLAWVLLAPAALWLRRRWPLERGALKLAVPVHLVAVVLLCAVHSGMVLSYDNYVRLHVGGKAHLLRETMNELEGALNPKQFARIHRSTIVNLDRVKELHPHVNEHLVILQDGTELKLSRTRKEWLEQWLGKGAG